MDGDKLALLSFTENLGYLWPFGVGFIEKSLSVFERDLFEKKSAKNKFLVLVKRGIFLVTLYFGNMPNFAGLWCPNHLTHRDSSNYYYNWRSSKYRVRHSLVVTGKLPQYLSKLGKWGLCLNLDIPQSC